MTDNELANLFHSRIFRDALRRLESVSRIARAERVMVDALVESARNYDKSTRLVCTTDEKSSERNV